MFKNSEMILQTILNEPKDLDAYRAYADALLEEGDATRGNFIIDNLGKRLVIQDARQSWNLFAFLDLASILGNVTQRLSLIVENGFIVHARLHHLDFKRNVEALFRLHPLQSVHISTRYPTSYPVTSVLEGLTTEQKEFTFFWRRGKNDENSHNYAYGCGTINTSHLPDVLVDRFPVESVLTRYWYGFVDERTALQAASIACVKYGRKLAELVPLPNTDYRELELQEVKSLDGRIRLSCANFEKFN